MDKPAQGKNAYRLIYEFNDCTPLFARVAFSELENGNVKNALETIEKGIEKFPSYPTPLLIYSVALAQEGKIDEALAAIKKARTIFHCEDSIKFYLEKIRLINEELHSLTESARFSFAPVELTDKPKFEDNLETLAEKLKTAKITAPALDSAKIPIKEEAVSSKLIISETMAKIFTAQDNIEGAIQIYEELIKANPGKTEFFLSKIEEIKKKGN